VTAFPSHNEPPEIIADNVDLDPLTGTLTRQAFFQRLIDRAAAANTKAHTFAICLVNADQLKNVNLSHGQQTGDQVLTQLTRRIRLDLAVTLSDTQEIDLCRYDGNGFALLIPDSDLEQASEAAESFRRAISETEIQRGLRVTVSVGVSQYRLWESAEDTLSRAEHALHLAKQFGRDRVEVAVSPKSRAEVAEVIPIDRPA
jgi:diguanylate cyclase